jgi:hypothetical protein
VVGQHHTAGPDPDVVRAGGDGRHQHRRAAARDAGHGVVLGHPEPVVPEPLGTLRPLDRVPERGGVRLAGAGARAVQQ